MSKITYRCSSCGTEHPLSQVRRSLYVGQRAIGDYQAFERGGVFGLGRRLARRKVTRTLMRSIWHS